MGQRAGQGVAATFALLLLIVITPLCLGSRDKPSRDGRYLAGVGATRRGDLGQDYVEITGGAPNGSRDDDDEGVLLGDIDGDEDEEATDGGGVNTDSGQRRFRQPWDTRRQKPGRRGSRPWQWHHMGVLTGLNGAGPQGSPGTRQPRRNQGRTAGPAAGQRRPRRPQSDSRAPPAKRARTGMWAGGLSIDSLLDVQWNVYNAFNQDKWWNGPNVCVRREEEEEALQTAKDDGTAFIQRHHAFSASVCDDTGTAYKCTTSFQSLDRKASVTVIHECCHGYQRNGLESGCTNALPLTTVLETLDSLGTTETLNAIESIGLSDLLSSGNYTVFAPQNNAFKDLKAEQDDDPNVVVINPNMLEMATYLEDALSAHVVKGFVRTTHFTDEQLIDTLNPEAKIRINIYDVPKKLLTANCIPFNSTDNMATNGVVHVVDDMLTPVTSSIASMVSSDPDLSTLKTVIGHVGMLSTLKAEGQFTMFAPTNAAFEKMDQQLKDKLLGGHSCLADLLKYHLMPNVICSSVIEGRVKSINMNDKYMNLTRSPDNKLFVNNAQIIKRDIMASNGVIHLIDDVMLPDDVWDVLYVMAREGASDAVILLNETGLSKIFQQLENFTMFLPTNEAIEALSASQMQELDDNRDALRDLVMYHVVEGELQEAELRNDAMLTNMRGDRSLLVKQYHSYPFSQNSMKTVQCARVIKSNLNTCGGVVHLIDKVLLLPGGDVLDTLYNNNEFSEIVTLIKKAGIAEELQRASGVTFFAPTNTALTALGEDTLTYFADNPENLAAFIKHHIANDVICCAGVFEKRWPWNQPEATLDGSVLATNRRGDDVFVNRVPVTRCDLTATNGVVHALETVLPDALAKYGPPPATRAPLGAPDFTPVRHWWDRHMRNMDRHFQNIRDFMNDRENIMGLPHMRRGFRRRGAGIGRGI